MAVSCDEWHGYCQTLKAGLGGGRLSVFISSHSRCNVSHAELPFLLSMQFNQWFPERKKNDTIITTLLFFCFFCFVCVFNLEKETGGYECLKAAA